MKKKTAEYAKKIYVPGEISYELKAADLARKKLR